MEFLLDMGTKPLFRLLGAILVLLITDFRPLYGAIAAVIWIAWIYVAAKFSRPG